MRNIFISYKSASELVVKLNEMLEQKFGKDLKSKSIGTGLSISTLSDFKSQKHKPSYKTSSTILSSLDLNQVEFDFALALIMEHWPSHTEAAKNRLHKIEKDFGYKKMNNQILSQERLNILEYIKLKSGIETVELAKQFDLSATALEDNLSILIDEGLVFKRKEKVFSNRKNITFYANKNSDEIKKFHLEMLETTKNALSRPVDKREFSTNYIKINEDDISKLKEEMISFRREMQQKYYQEGTGDELLYVLNMQLFEL